MRPAFSAVRAVRTATASRIAHIRFASTLLRMPAMSPTMTEGGIAAWKVKEGENYSAGDVIMEIETDKATIDVEAQDDGVMGKILFPSGSKNVPVGETIAVLAEQGDDLSKLEVPTDLSPPKQDIPTEDGVPEAPKEEPKAAAPAAPAGPAADHHSKPMFPSVAALIHETGLSQAQLDSIKPTGLNGLITRGDVLKALGKVSSPYGTAEKMITDALGPSGKRKSEPKHVWGSSSSGEAAKKPEPPLDGPSLRRLIVAGLTKATAPAPAPSTETDFDDIIADYIPRAQTPPAAAAPAPAVAPEDELAGLI